MQEPAAAAPRQDDDLPAWTLVDVIGLSGRRINSTTARAAAGRPIEVSSPPGLTCCFAHCPDLAPLALVLVSGADGAFIPVNVYFSKSVGVLSRGDSGDHCVVLVPECRLRADSRMVYASSRSTRPRPSRGAPTQRRWPMSRSLGHALRRVRTQQGVPDPRRLACVGSSSGSCSATCSPTPPRFARLPLPLPPCPIRDVTCTGYTFRMVELELLLAVLPPIQNSGRSVLG